MKVLILKTIYNTSNMKTTRLIWKCTKCEDVQVSYSDLRHNMNMCECGESGVDLEEYYQRNMGYIEVIDIKEKVGS